MVETDRKREDEWFHRNERQLLEAARAARQKRESARAAEEKAEERKRLKDLHFMKCPKCGHDMKEEPGDDVMIDRCTFCEGIYLDPGELEKLFLGRAEEQKNLLRRLIGI